MHYANKKNNRLYLDRQNDTSLGSTEGLSVREQSLITGGGSVDYSNFTPPPPPVIVHYIFALKSPLQFACTEILPPHFACSEIFRPLHFFTAPPINNDCSKRMRFQQIGHWENFYKHDKILKIQWIISRSQWISQTSSWTALGSLIKAHPSDKVFQQIQLSRIGYCSVYLFSQFPSQKKWSELVKEVYCKKYCPIKQCDLNSSF